MRWIDTHCHLDAAEFCVPGLTRAPEVRARAAGNGVAHCVIPAVEASNFTTVSTLAEQFGDSYCLGIHPLYVPRAAEEDLDTLAQQLALRQHDRRLVAVGEIGLDYFVPELAQSPQREKQEHFYRTQLRLARAFDLPVVLHVRRSVDRVLKHLREVGQGGYRWSGIAHAFNGSAVQAQVCIEMGLKLGFGGAMTFARAHRLQHLAQTLPLESIVLETDAPDIPPYWLYTPVGQRVDGIAQGRNEPGELPRIGATLAALRELPVDVLAGATTRNACEALPRLAALLV